MTRHVYVHVPFCSRRCSYCDFAVAIRREAPIADYLDSLHRELEIRFPGEHSEVDTIYLGGGTPSKLGGDGIARALEIVSRHFFPHRDAELTLEANPEDVRADTVREWRSAGVNRLSIGAQTFHAGSLEWMHRTHDADTTINAVHAARDGGINNLSLDLIFALPGALGRNLEDDIERLLRLNPDHVSIYGLTIESGTPLGKWVARGETLERADDGYETEYLLADQLLTRAGLQHYEVSNYALPGHHSRHNSAYWTGASYVGLGPSAHGFNGMERRWNARYYDAWRDLTLSDVDPVDGAETLTRENTFVERVYLGLRSAHGLAKQEADAPLLSQWRNAGWIVDAPDGRIRCTPLGWLRLDALAAALTDHRSR